MKPRTEVSERIKNIEVDREKFEAVVKKMLSSPPTSKAEVSRKLRAMGRKRPLTRPLL
jgi:hypothetical protein